MESRPYDPIPNSPEFETLAAGAQFRDRIAVPVSASPEAIFRALHELSLADMKLAWILGELRYLPARVTGRKQPDDPHRPFLDVLRDGGTLILRDAPYEVITGSAGQLHRLVDQAPVKFENARDFAEFDEPDHQKLFMSLRVAPGVDPRTSWLVLDHATRALSPQALAKFKTYWRIIKPAGAFVSHELLVAIRAKAEAGAAAEAA